MEKELNGMDNYLSGLATEHVNEETQNLDRCSTLDMVEMINRQDAKVAAAVAQESGQIARAVDLICDKKAKNMTLTIRTGLKCRIMQMAKDKIKVVREISDNNEFVQ